VNEALELIIPAVYDWAEDFYDGAAVVSVDGKWGAVDTAGQVTVPLIYDYIRIAFYPAGIAFYRKNDKLGYVHKSGREITPPIYDMSFHQCGSSSNMSSFSEGMAMVERDGRFGFIDESGDEVIPLIYDAAFPFRDGTAQVYMSGEWFIIDKTGYLIGAFVLVDPN
jgi:hypothetical protein